jgi:hypothetical protein
MYKLVLTSEFDRDRSLLDGYDRQILDAYKSLVNNERKRCVVTKILPLNSSIKKAFDNIEDLKNYLDSTPDIPNPIIIKTVLGFNNIEDLKNYLDSTTDISNPIISEFYNRINKKIMSNEFKEQTLKIEIYNDVNEVIYEY